MTGSLPPDVCGVGEYANALLKSLDGQPITTSLFYTRNWSISSLLRYASRIRRSGAKLLNIQYPTQGYGWSIVPQLLCVLVKPIKTVITLHEFSNRSFKAKLASYLFFFFSDYFIFTVDHERDVSSRLAPWIRSKSCVIPLASNIPIHYSHAAEVDIVYFGHIRPSKGLEEFIETVNSIRNKRRYRIQVIGQIVQGFDSYTAGILEEVKALGVEIILNRSSTEVSYLLSRARVALLPFPDGFSLRRGSALASMSNGALLVTTPPPNRPIELDKICITSSKTTGLAEVVITVLDNYALYEHIRVAGCQFARSFSWETVAAMYIQQMKKLTLYENEVNN